jgi:hypothetical protein
MAVANRIGGDAGLHLATLARASFVDAMGTTLLVAAAVAAVGSVITFVLLPSRASAKAAVPLADDHEALASSAMLEAA